MRNKIIFIAAIMCLFIISGLFGFCSGGKCIEAFEQRQISANYVRPGVPKRIVSAFGRQFERLDASTEPKFLPASVFKTVEGKDARIKDFSGKPTLVNLWASWCMPCVVELPSLQKLATHYENQMNVVAINVEKDRPGTEIADFLEKRRFGDFAGYIDQSGEFATSLGLRGIPTSFLIGSDGLILYRFEGDADWSGPDSKAFFDVFLMQKR